MAPHVQWRTIMRFTSAVGSVVMFGVLATALVACSSVPAANIDDSEGEKPAALVQPPAATVPVQPPGPRCGDRVCSADESCSTCAQDCGACKCVEAPACNVAASPPATIPATPQLDVKFEAKSKEKILAQLKDLVATGSHEVRTFAAALSAPRVGEPMSVQHLRAMLSENESVASMLRRQLANAGMSSADVYRARFPESYPTPRTSRPTNGPVDCGPPQLSLRVAKITVDEPDDNFAKDIVYCSVGVDAPRGSELRVTPKTPNLDEGESHEFTVPEGTVWGQRGPREPGGDMTITYDCFEADTNDGYYAFLRALASEGARNGNMIDESGWVSDVSGTAARLLPLIIALDTDDHLFEATQVIPAAEHLKLTRGGAWTVRKEGEHFLMEWAWSVRMEAWGCAVNGGGTAPPPQDAGTGG